MPINKRELFERTKALWPSVVGLDHASKNDKYSDIAQELNDLYYQIEATIDENDHWMQIAIWSYHQSIPEPPIEKNIKIYPRNVDFADFDKMMIENLEGDDCWLDERNQWGHLEAPPI